MRTCWRLLVLCLSVAPAARAQEPTQSSSGDSPENSRAADIPRSQSAKAQGLAPYVPGAAERLITWVESTLEKPTHVWWNFGPMESGAGFRLGLEYVTHTGDRTAMTARAAYSVLGYESLEARIASPGHLGDRLDLAVSGVWRNAPQMPFYGVGNDTSSSNRTHFLLRDTSGAVSARARPTAWRAISVGVEARLTDYRTGAGSGRSPSIESRFAAADAPHLGTGPAYWRYTGEAAIDTRPNPGYSRHGTLVRGAYSAWRDRADFRFAFSRLDTEVTQLIPILRGNWIVALHGEAASTGVGRGSGVPYFLLPYLGSGSTLRGYSSFRFRDRHALLLSGELRWTPNEAFDMAIFYDAGKVAPRRRELDLKNLNTDIGIGARFHGDSFTALRIEAARSREGLRLVVGTGPVW
jgi:hypothetical protein